MFLTFFGAVFFCYDSYLWANQVHFAKKLSPYIFSLLQGGSKHFTPPFEGSPPPTQLTNPSHKSQLSRAINYINVLVASTLIKIQDHRRWSYHRRLWNIKVRLIASKNLTASEKTSVYHKGTIVWLFLPFIYTLFSCTLLYRKTYIYNLYMANILDVYFLKSFLEIDLQLFCSICNQTKKRK